MIYRPTLPSPTAWNLPAPRTDELENGLRAMCYSRPGQHVVTVAAHIELPLSSEPRAKEGLAMLVQRTLDEGTAAHPGTAFAEEMEKIGAELSGYVNNAHSVIFLTVPATRLDPALALMAEALRTPAFAPDDIERHIRLREAELEQISYQSSPRAESVFRGLVLDPDTRASRLSGGSSSTIAAIDSDDVAAFHASWYRPDATTVVLGGDFENDPLPSVRRHFADWENGGVSQVHEVNRPGQGGLVLADRPSAVQADIRFGGFSLDRTDPHWPSLRVATYIVGGEFMSRLNRVLREERGYTYGISMAQNPLRTGGYFSVRGSFRTEVVAAALAETRDLLNVTSFSKTEVQAAIDYFVGSTGVRFSTADAIVHEVVNVLGAGLEPAYINTSLEAITQVTPESALEAYSLVVTGQNLSLAVVGEADALAEPLQAQGFDVTVVEADEPLR